MSTVTADTHAHEHADDHAHVGGFLSTYVFSRDHKITGLQFLFSTLQCVSINWPKPSSIQKIAGCT